MVEITLYLLISTLNGVHVVERFHTLPACRAVETAIEERIRKDHEVFCQRATILVKQP